ncbi:MAG: hypothetical protein V1779_16900 [bacterium]
MGIHSEFRYGIELYNYSFAFSNLKNDRENEKGEFSKSNNSFKYLASISRELFNGKAGSTKPVRAKYVNNWAFTCL